MALERETTNNLYELSSVLFVLDHLLFKEAGLTILLLLTFLENNHLINFTYNTFKICKNIDRSMCLFRRYKGFKKGKNRTPLDSS